jgi:ribosomal protein S25
MAGKTLKELLKEKEINPLKDFRIYHPPLYDIKIVKGEKVSVPEKFLKNLETEGVIQPNSKT